jgi:hypothetical protein
LAIQLRSPAWVALTPCGTERFFLVGFFLAGFFLAGFFLAGEEGKGDFSQEGPAVSSEMRESYARVDSEHPTMPNHRAQRMRLAVIFGDHRVFF